jgi:acetyl esterase/lipase
VTAFALQSVALWLPWRWSYGFAANATAWPVIQLACSLLVLLVAVGFYYLMRRTTAIVFGAVGVLTIIPVAVMFITLNTYAHGHAATLDVFEQRHVIRGIHPASNDVQYAQIEGQGVELSVYRNSDIAKRSPAVVYVHGGGWSGGSRTENSELFNWLNGQGYTVFSVDYRYANDSYASWQDAPSDVVCALAWLNKHADAQQIDGDNVAIMGDSAGGQLALRAAYGVKSGDVRSSCNGQPLTPKKVIALVPAVDFRELYDDPRLGPTSRTNVVRYLGGTPSTAAQAYDESSIATHVKAGLQPTLIINAANDTLVSPDSGERLAAELKKAGVAAEQYTLPYAAHSYWINPGGYQNQMARALIERFLSK